MNFQNIDVPTFQQKMEANPESIILDVRTEVEKEEGDIEGSILINIMSPDFYTEIEDLDKTKPCLVFCRSGNRSARACMILSENGFQELYNLEGGIQAWNKQNK